VRRRYLWIGVDGSGGGVEGGGTVLARVCRGQATALATTATVGPQGALHVEVRTTARLLPDEYELQVVAPDKPDAPLAKTTFRVGTPEEVEPAKQRLRGWLVGARGALRDMAAMLERRAAFHRNRLLADVQNGGRPSGGLVNAQAASFDTALDNLALRLRAARMDFVPYEREVLLSPYPVAGAALAGLFPAIQARRDELRKAVKDAEAGRGKDTPLAPPAQILKLAAEAAQDLKLEGDDSATWTAGPLAEPERGSVVNRHFASALGVSVDVPQGDDWKIADRPLDPADRPEDRLVVIGPEAITITVRVRELPGQDTSDLAHLVEMLLWEELGNDAYTKIATEGAPGRYKLEGRIRPGNYPYHILAVDRAPQAGGRIFELFIMCPDPVWEKRRPELEKVVASFALDEKK
jgi:hypothetical protein